jgi:uncharacterized membrane protein YcaP (DUF421 family)
VKGDRRQLIKDGEILWDQMKRAHITKHDIEQFMRRSGREAHIEEILNASLERNGEISIHFKDQ